MPCLEEPLLIGKQTLFSLWFYMVCSYKVLVNRMYLGTEGFVGELWAMGGDENCAEGGV